MLNNSHNLEGKEILSSIEDTGQEYTLSES